MLDFNTLEFDNAYAPNSKVSKDAQKLLDSLYIEIDNRGHNVLSSRVRSIKRVINSDLVRSKGDALLCIECEAWTYARHYWKVESEDDHTLDTLYCNSQYVLIRRSVLHSCEIDDQFGITDWEEVDFDGFSAKTDSGKVPDYVLMSYLNVLSTDSENLDAEYYEAECPSLEGLDPRVRCLADQAIGSDDD